jgi:ankyrin
MLSRLAVSDNLSSIINSVDWDGYTPLCYAALYGRVECAYQLFGHNANPNLPETNNSFTPLHLAVYAGSVDLVQLLLDKGCEVNPCTSSGLTPLRIFSLVLQLFTDKILRVTMVMNESLTHFLNKVPT